MIMIIFIQKRDRRYRKIIYNKKNLVPILKPPRRPKRPVWGHKWLGQEVISAVVHDMKKGTHLLSNEILHDANVNII